MQTRKLIRVTKRDIELGWNGDFQSCPIARALDRAGIVPDVGTDIIVMSNGEGIPLPKRAARFSLRQARDASGMFGSNLKSRALRVLKPFSFVLKYGGD